jgi:hypothetical protein
MGKLMLNGTLLMMMMIPVLLVTGCTSSTSKTDEAREKAGAAQQNLTSELNDSAKKALRLADEAEWNAYKADAEVKITKNKATIAALKKDIKTMGNSKKENYEKSVLVLEKQNEGMESRISVYEKEHSNWESFKREFSHDMDGLGNALKDFFINNK